MGREKEVLLVLAALTVLHVIENLWFVPWSPLMVIFGILAILIPLKYRKREELGLKRPERRKDFLKYTALGVAVSLAFSVAMQRVYPLAMDGLGLKGNIQYDYWVAMDVWIENIMQKFGADFGFAWLGLFMLVWAPIGEELLYRGYAFNSLLEKRSFVIASTTSTLYFAVRHFAHLTPSLSTFPIASGLLWGILVIPPAYVWCYVLQKTRSLYSTMLIHFLVNLIPSILYSIQALPT